MARRIASLVVVLSTFSARADWAPTFAPVAVAQKLGPKGIAVLVVAAGEQPRDSRPATTALEAALRQGGAARLVMTDGAIGAVDRLDDAAIVKKAAALPVDLVAVVRVFPRTAGAGPTAVVTLYEKDGKVRTAFVAEEGKPLPEEPAAKGEGVSAIASASVSKALDSARQQTSSGRDEYEKKYLWFEDVHLVNARSGAMIGTVSTVHRGKYKEVVSEDEFYRIIDREDLGRVYAERSRTRKRILWSGAAVSLLGLGVFAFGLTLDDNSTRLAVVPGGLLLTLAGAGVMAGSALYNPSPLTPSQVRELADRYNQKLRDELGVHEARRLPPGRGVQVALRF